MCDAFCHNQISHPLDPAATTSLNCCLCARVTGTRLQAAPSNPPQSPAHWFPAPGAQQQGAIHPTQPAAACVAASSRPWTEALTGRTSQARFNRSPQELTRGGGQRAPQRSVPTTSSSRAAQQAAATRYPQHAAHPAARVQQQHTPNQLLQQQAPTHPPQPASQHGP
jgi:hypothetical protein